MVSIILDTSYVALTLDLHHFEPCNRGKVLGSPWAPALIATWHPSAVLRAVDAATRERMRVELRSDLELAAARASKT
jgi:hypothetical protein